VQISRVEASYLTNIPTTPPPLLAPLVPRLVPGDRDDVTELRRRARARDLHFLCHRSVLSRGVGRA
jgi:hypothetical protein